MRFELGLHTNVELGGTGHDAMLRPFLALIGELATQELCDKTHLVDVHRVPINRSTDFVSFPSKSFL